MFVLALLACSNASLPDWSGGGTHYASGLASDGDTATTGGDTGTTAVTGDGSPELIGMSAIYSEPNEAGQTFISVGVAYTDDPDDVSGGNVYYSMEANGEVQDEGQRSLVDADPDPNTDGLIEAGNISFSIGPIDTSMTHAVTLYVVDYNHNRSNEIADDVTGG